MGYNDRVQNRKEEKRNAAATKRKRRSNPVAGGVPADWNGVDGDLLRRAVACIARDGGALRLGYTRDGGAYALGIYGDGEPFTEYVPPSDDIDEYLRGLVEDYEK